MTTKTTKVESKVSVYRFAKDNNVRPQQIYQMIQNGSFPEELLSYEQVGDRTQPLVNVAEAQAWLQQRKTRNVPKAEMVDAVLGMIDDAKLQAALKKYFDAKEAEANKAEAAQVEAK